MRPHHRSKIVFILSLSLSGICAAQMKPTENPPQVLTDAWTKTNPCVAGAAPFVLKAQFISKTNGITGTGSYALLWAAPDKWRREVKAGDLSVTQTRNGDDMYTKSTSGQIPDRALWLFYNVARGCFAKYPPGAERMMQQRGDGPSSVMFAEQKVTEDKKNDITRFVVQSAVPLVTDVRTSTGLVIAVPGNFAAQFSNYQPFRNVTVAREGTTFEKGAATAQFKISSIEEVPAPNEKEFVLDTKPSSVNDRASSTFVAPKAKAPVRAEYPLMAKNSTMRGTAQITCTIDKTGAVKDARVTQSSGFTLLDGAALRAVEAAAFEPATRNGEAVEVTYRYNMVFNRPGFGETFGLPMR